MRSAIDAARDLRIWWWTIAVVGLTACVGLLANPGAVRICPLILGWLAAFTIIGLYQRLADFPSRTRGFTILGNAVRARSRRPVPARRRNLRLKDQRNGRFV
jgi:hypothetical protein